MLAPESPEERPFTVRRDELIAHFELVAARTERRADTHLHPHTERRWAAFLRKLAALARQEK